VAGAEEGGRDVVWPVLGGGWVGVVGGRTREATLQQKKRGVVVIGGSWRVVPQWGGGTVRGRSGGRRWRRGELREEGVGCLLVSVR